ncbi:prepilin-type N-terminal cleavage/methylation domain-containing protein [Clostridium pasteurianum DSM 525 = ATCC 6013]|uniref:Prepilin-type N-terminal cleavage/methylation domain-containing protein n=1 Tax=Clostridium pasteurianum DSM 525 = ATCC 6013 TaxID=1262449 RepID=A0A0H3J8Y6_CLOPA|nr:prepilin-type N-terminal cleavage/methylation domain-containing protein [Clostridium pasteurianum]AJA47560.1 prepilin-type N-terminal cleavage/methylation domain-containing protein [Clostridium pasteurianum DSM 525 = ATCC 6013]AJA51548.1 prepilin-type N-terminal cleavage/methylation domain-containing protein [Clostridium pasteurianum DSM 525 = ATCC 6013]AOZ74875.1 hypothetical protein AQ983_07175 [Clostridium pasteurianum DSM 525 = ATCC 6013]AOZ78670.1 hypothetical protein AQ984_07165 [Clost
MKNKGFSLIELIAVIPIILIVLTLVFAINNFSNKIFNKSVNQSYSQQNTRIAADYITRELRNATNVSATKNISGTYYAITVKDNNLIEQTISNNTITSEKIIINQLSSMNVEELNKASDNSAPSVLKIKVTDNSNNQNYELTFTCLLNNIHNEIQEDQNWGNIIYYYSDQQ